MNNRLLYCCYQNIQAQESTLYNASDIVIFIGSYVS